MLDNVVDCFWINWVWMLLWGLEWIIDDGCDMMWVFGFVI